MLKINQELSFSKKIIFFSISTIFSLLFILLIITGYFAYKKLILSYDYCKSFGEINSEIGWTLKKDTISCLSLTNKITGEVFFDTKIFIDNNGFRSSENESRKMSNFLTIGDSWTFGYGVNHEETYPYFLSKLLNEPVHNSGIPAYGTGSNYLNAKSNIEKLRPKTVI